MSSSCGPTQSRRWIAILLCFLAPLTGGCPMQTVKLAPWDIQDPAREEIVGITTMQGEEVEFDPPGGRVRGDFITANVDGRVRSYALEDVDRLWVLRESGDKDAVFGVVLLIGIGVAVIAGIAALAAKGFCPFVYSWDGERFVFDAEPYGGAITRGLERDDYSELGKLQAVDGEYRLRITNEVRETQHTNLMELWVVDHDEGTRLVADEWGNLHALREQRSLISAVDGSGRDLLPWLAATDGRIWEPRPDDSGADAEMRQEIFLTFPKPQDAAQVRLVANAATGLWGSHMIRELLELHGRDVGDWYDLIDSDAGAREELHARILREELYRLEVDVETATGWETRGVLQCEGPFIAKDRVVPLDLSGVTADRLRIRIRPPSGFWALNSFAVDYGPDEQVRPEVVLPHHARDASGTDVLPALLAADDQYYSMPRTGDQGAVSFPAPERIPGLNRTVFLHSRGYYQLHLSADQDPDLETLRTIREEPGAAARFGARRFTEWRDQRIRAAASEPGRGLETPVDLHQAPGNVEGRAILQIRTDDLDAHRKPR